jgi:hypothetical protein
VRAALESFAMPRVRRPPELEKLGLGTPFFIAIPPRRTRFAGRNPRAADRGLGVPCKRDRARDGFRLPRGAGRVFSRGDETSNVMGSAVKARPHRRERPPLPALRGSLFHLQSAMSLRRSQPVQSHGLATQVME